MLRWQQHTGHAKLHDSDNTMTAHQAESQAVHCVCVCANGLQQYHTGQHKLSSWEN